MLAYEDEDSFVDDSDESEMSLSGGSDHDDDVIQLSGSDDDEPATLTRATRASRAK